LEGATLARTARVTTHKLVEEVLKRETCIEGASGPSSVILKAEAKVRPMLVSKRSASREKELLELTRLALVGSGLAATLLLLTQALLAQLVVYSPFLCIAQNLVGSSNESELSLGFFVTAILVRMVPFREFEVCPLDFSLGSVSRNPQHCVVRLCGLSERHPWKPRRHP